MRRILTAALATAIVVTACSSGPLTAAEYGERVEALVQEMAAGFDEIDAEWTSAPPSLDGAAEYWDERLEIRRTFLAGITRLTPPPALDALHDASLDLFTRITDADEATAISVAGYEDIADHWQWVDTPEGRASDAILVEVFEFCRAAQAEFDGITPSGAFGDIAWVPEMKDIAVAFGCPE
jgi:hypothetical protein